jgi:RNA polymerase sigma-70 factor (ECF subfamily)
MKYYENERSLVQLIMNGDPAAYQFLYNKNRNWIYNKVNSILHNECETEEVVQDIFTEIFDSITKFKGASSLNTWIYRITLNKAFNRFRYMNAAKRKREIPLEPFLIMNALPVYNYSEDSSVEYPITFEQLIPIINSLQEKQRKAFILCMVQKNSYEQAAERMSCSVDSIRGLLHRAKNNIRTEATRSISQQKQVELMCA